MSFISLWFILFVFFINGVFYAVPLRWRNAVLLIASLIFVLSNSGAAVIWLLGAGAAAWLYGRGVEEGNKACRSVWGLAGISLLILFPLVLLKYVDILPGISLEGKNLVFSALLAPVGISFYTLSLLSYVADVYRKKYVASNKIGEFFIFLTFFPQIVQGPIARYDRNIEEFRRVHRFSWEGFTHGWQLILWGYFQKFIVADKAGIMVDAVYSDLDGFPGLYVAIAAALYSVQLYADFCGCVNIALGVAQTFGIFLEENFRQPYFAVSVREFWRRWHMTLGGWLKDYIYIPLGGNRKGEGRQQLNILAVFAVSGLWHGAGLTYFLWGLLHGVYQSAELAVERWGKKAGARKEKAVFDRKKGAEGKIGRAARLLLTFLLVTFAWMLFRAENLEHFVHMLRSMFSVWNPEVILDGNMWFRMGLSRLQTIPLVLGILAMTAVDCLHEGGYHIRAWVDRRSLPVRWLLYLAALLFILVFGTYGPAYSGNQFIYGRF